MESERNFTAIGRVSHLSGQTVQHFMSNSPWSASLVLEQVQAEVKATPPLQAGNVLILDESADEKAGETTVGAGRQYNGRLGKVEMSQVGTFLALAHPSSGIWTWIDGELFLPQIWFGPEKTELRKRLGVPKDRTYQTKVELGWTMIQRVHRRGVPFEIVCCDDLYGRSDAFRSKLDQAELLYMADVPATTRVLRSPPDPSKPPERSVKEVGDDAQTVWKRVEVRPTERGVLVDRFAAVRVKTWRDGSLTDEWLVIREHTDGKRSYAFSNAPPETALKQLAEWKCARAFVECAIRDAKSEAGFDELRAVKYPAWEHHLALTVMATWFVAQTKLEWAQAAPPDPTLAEELKVDRLPTLSMANVREMLRAVMPLPQLTPDEAVRQVVEHLFNRTRSRKSRLLKGSRSP